MVQPYIHRKVHDKLYIIAEMHNPFPANEKNNPPHTCTMGLVIGEERAALIDTGAGIGDIAKYVSQLTDLPVIVLNTHGHLDHIGANCLFEKSYISEKDVCLFPANTRENRLGFLKSVLEGSPEVIEYAENNIIGDMPFNYEFIQDGDVIDLGGVQLEVVAFPGHTKGSLTFVDRRDNIVFTGDSILFRILLSRDAVPDFVKSLDYFAEKTEGIDTIINGHQWEPFNKNDMYELRACAMEIINGAQGEPYSLLGRPWMLHRYGKKRIAVSESALL